jgi:hypothetical protein
MKYTPRQLAKMIVAALTAAVALIGLVAVVFATGPLHAIGAWAATMALVLNPILVYVTRAQTIIDAVPGEPPA